MEFASSLEKCIDHCMNDLIEEHMSEMRVKTWAKLELHLITHTHTRTHTSITYTLATKTARCPSVAHQHSVKALNEFQSSISRCCSRRCNIKFYQHSQPEKRERKLTKKSSMHVSALSAKPWSNLQIVNKWLNNTPSKHSDCNTQVYLVASSQ